SGELLFRSSSDAAEIASSLTGSGGTMIGSTTGSGGAGGRDGAAVFAGGTGGGIGRAIGGFLAPQATAAVNDRSAINICIGLAALIVDSPLIWTSPASRCCRSS